MQNFGELIRTLREKEGFPLRKLAAFLDIDQAVLSKIERGQRKFSREQVIKLSQFFNYNQKEMLIAFLSDRIISEIGDEEFAKEALIVAEEKIEYQVFKKLDREKILFEIKITLKQFTKINKAWICD